MDGGDGTGNVAGSGDGDIAYAFAILVSCRMVTKGYAFAILSRLQGERWIKRKFFEHDNILY